MNVPQGKMVVIALALIALSFCTMTSEARELAALVLFWFGFVGLLLTMALLAYRE